MDVKIKLDGNGLNFDGGITLFQATQIMAFIARPIDPDKADTPIELLSDPIQTGERKQITNTSRFESPREAINTLQAKTNPQKVVALALYLGASSENGMVVEFDSILTEFAKAGEPTPKNISRDVKDAVTAGYVYPESKTSFRLLSSADAVPDQGFKKIKRRRGNSPKTANGKAAPKLVVREEVLSMPITTTLDGFADYFDFKGRADQILWILKYAESNKLNALNRLEITHICSKLGGTVDSKGFTSGNTANVKNGYISSAGSLFSITAKGNKYMSAEMVSGKKSKSA